VHGPSGQLRRQTVVRDPPPKVLPTSTDSRRPNFHAGARRHAGIRILWWKPGSSNSMARAYLKSMRQRTASAACRSDSPSTNCSTQTVANWAGDRPGRPSRGYQPAKSSSHPPPVQPVPHPHRRRTARIARPRDLRGQRRDLLTGTGTERQRTPRQLHRSWKQCWRTGKPQDPGGEAGSYRAWPRRGTWRGRRSLPPLGPVSEPAPPPISLSLLASRRSQSHVVCLRAELVQVQDRVVAPAVSTKRRCSRTLPSSPSPRRRGRHRSSAGPTTTERAAGAARPRQHKSGAVHRSA